MSSAITSSRTVERFAAYFAGRTDARGTFDTDKNGELKYIAVREPITLDHYRKHLVEGVTLGIYALSNDGLTTWGCFDFDQGDIEQAIRCKDLLGAYGIAAHLRQVMRAVLRNAACPPETEIYPKQDRIRPSSDAPLGSMVNLPFPGNGAPGKRVMLDDNLVEMTADEWIAIAVQNDPALLFKIVPHPAPPDDGRQRVITATSNMPGYRGPDPACIAAAVQLPAGPGSRHNIGMRLAQYWTHTRKLDADAVWGLLEDWNERNSPPLNEADLQNCAQGVQSDPTCTWLRKEKLFADACTWTACAFHRPGEGKPAPQVLTLADWTTSEYEMPDAAANAGDAASEQRMVARLCEVGFIGAFVDWMRQSTDAPALYHCLAAMATIATALGNDVSAESFGNTRVRPNIWLAIIAPSGIYRKSTSINAAESILSHYAEMPERILAHDFTSASFINGLAENPAGLLVIDELSGFLQSMNQKYQSGTKMLLTKLWEGGSHTVTRVGSGTTTVNNAAISILAASTKDNLQRELDQSDFATGFLARMLFVPGSIREGWKGLGSLRPDQSAPDALAAAVRQFRQYAGVISFADVFEQFDTWDETYERSITPENTMETLTGLVSRAGRWVQKFAILFQVGASLRDQKGVSSWGRIEPWALELAIEWVQWVIKGQTKMMSSTFAFTATGRDRQRLLELLRKHSGHMSRTDLSRNTEWSGKELDKVVESCEEAGFLETKYLPNESGTGRPVTIYQLVGVKEVKVKRTVGRAHIR